MITYLCNAIGVDPSLIGSDFALFCGMMLVIVCAFGLTKGIFNLFKTMF